MQPKRENIRGSTFKAEAQPRPTAIQARIETVTALLDDALRMNRDMDMYVPDDVRELNQKRITGALKALYPLGRVIDGKFRNKATA